MTDSPAPKLTFHIGLPRGGRAPAFFVKAVSEYEAAQGVALILKAGTYARRHAQKEGVWEVYRHVRGEDWGEGRSFQVTEVKKKPNPELEGLYTERAHLVAALSKLWPASLETDPADPEWPVCIIDAPDGELSWHVAPEDLALFDHLPREAGRIWDGHSTELKYQRLDALKHHYNIGRTYQRLDALTP